MVQPLPDNQEISENVNIEFELIDLYENLASGTKTPQAGNGSPSSNTIQFELVEENPMIFSSLSSIQCEEFRSEQLSDDQIPPDVTYNHQSHVGTKAEFINEDTEVIQNRKYTTGKESSSTHDKNFDAVKLLPAKPLSNQSTQAATNKIETDNLYHCHLCNFTCHRLNVVMLHFKTHLK